MAVRPGEVLNPKGYNGREKYGYRAKNKMQTAMDIAIDLLGEKNIRNCGTSRLAELIAEKLESDVIGTLKALSSLLPKQVQVDVNHSLNASQMSDEQLLQIIESRQKTIEHTPGNTLEHADMADNQAKTIELVKE